MALGGTLGTVLRLVPAITSLSDGLYLLSGAAGAAGLSMAGVYTLGIAFIIAGLVALYLKFQWFRDAVALIGQALYLEFVQPWVGLYEALIGPFKAAMNWIISHWNSLKFVIGKIHLPGIPDIGGISLIRSRSRCSRPVARCRSVAPRSSGTPVPSSCRTGAARPWSARWVAARGRWRTLC
jgi:hypothetical protein